MNSQLSSKPFFHCEFYRLIQYLSSNRLTGNNSRITRRINQNPIIYNNNNANGNNDCQSNIDYHLVNRNSLMLSSHHSLKSKSLTSVNIQESDLMTMPNKTVVELHVHE